MLHTLLESASLQKAIHALQQGSSLLIEDLWSAPKAALVALAQQATGKHILVLTGARQDERRLFHDFALFTDRRIIDFPAWETLPSENVPPSPDIVGERYCALKEVSTGPCIIFSSLQACLQKVLVPRDFDKLYLSLKVGTTYAWEALIERLQVMGYVRCTVAADKGEFAIRGGIIDVFPVSSPAPLRIEFSGDDIESMRTYDPIGQRSIKEALAVEIAPARELELITSGQTLATLLDYLGDNTLLFLDDMAALEDRYAALISICGTATPYFCSLAEFFLQAESLQKIFTVAQPLEELTHVTMLAKEKGNYYSAAAPLIEVSFEMFSRQFAALRFFHPFVPLVDMLLPDHVESSGLELLRALPTFAKSPLRLYFLCNGAPELEGLQKKIEDEGLALPLQTHYQMGYLSSGFSLPDIQVMLFPMAEITGRHKIRRQQQRTTFHTLPTETFNLLPGDIVVHFNFGIGKYLGLEKKPIHTGALAEFLILEYAEGSKIYVPLSQAHLVSKYVGANEERQPLHTVGSNRWQKIRDRTALAIEGYASELLELYAQRKLSGGFACLPDGDQLQAFEEDFPFIETEDQLAAIGAIKDDMRSERCMDRLVCGDVGYGKTEVAMRAAFKAVVDGGKQVAVLVPTTVLAMQHYESFIERMGNFAVTVGVLSRFRTAKQIRQTIEGVSKGSIDIVIGTHRLISQDIHFKNLGLVIIDEEQRFGVKAKEHLKQMKSGVDCLTLSATPIPRTLYLSLIGARDMSVINTPPQDRLPITTIVAESAEAVFKTAIARELAREGQVFVIHNRVETSYEMAARIKKLFPLATIDVCHGQMGNEEIDLVFHRFKSGQTQILIATTIVENGIDIPNANTILIDRADHFGLADLYQLRGRVGRWNRRAYAYLLVKSLSALPEIARRRLYALAESSGYGGGMKVARHDLELRGAGNILGVEQSGQVAAIGFHLYCKMLKKTILRLQGKSQAGYIDPKIDCPVDARLPEAYVNDTHLRIEICQRFGEAATLEEAEVLWIELKDRFGRPPVSAEWLYCLIRLKIIAAEHSIAMLKFERSTLFVEMSKGSAIQKFPLVLPSQPLALEAKVLACLKK